MPHSEHRTDGCTATASGFSEHDLGEVAAAMRSLSQRVSGDGSDRAPLERLASVAVERVPGARWASITVLRGGRFTTSASTAEQALRADILQYEMESGPCVDAVLEDSLKMTGQVSTDSRWSEWGQRANSEVGVNSVLSQRLHPQTPSGVIAGLNIYSDTQDAFDQTAVGVAVILATHGALVLSEMLAALRVGTLNKALQSNRDIGVAIGILMHQHRVTRQEAFDVLRISSQNSNRKLAEIAAEVVDRGALTINRLV